MTELRVHVKNTFFEACSLDDEDPPSFEVLRRSASCPSLSPSKFVEEDGSSSCRLSCTTSSTGDPTTVSRTTPSPRWADSDDNSASSQTGGEEPIYDSDDDDDDRLWPMPWLVVAPVALRKPDPALAAPEEERVVGDWVQLGASRRHEEPSAAEQSAARTPLSRTPLGSAAPAFTPGSTRLSSKAVAYMPFQPAQGLGEVKSSRAGTGSPGDLQAWATAGPNGAPARPNGDMFTTAMMRNLPCHMTRTSLTKMLDKAGFAGCYDFIYMPVDFRTSLSMGYAFVNMVSEGEFHRLTSAFQSFSNWPLKSAKVCSVSPSQTQGLAANLERYQNSPVMGDEVPEKYKPVLFVNSQKVAFPKPTKVLPGVIQRQVTNGFIPWKRCSADQGAAPPKGITA